MYVNSSYAFCHRNVKLYTKMDPNGRNMYTGYYVVTAYMLNWVDILSVDYPMYVNINASFVIELQILPRDAS